MRAKIKVAVLDDYQHAAKTMAGWGVFDNTADITFLHGHLAQEQILAKLQSFEVLCVMRERTPLNRETLSGLKQLKLVISTGTRNASIDLKAAEELGITIKNTGYLETGAPELTWALLTALARHITVESNNSKPAAGKPQLAPTFRGKPSGLLVWVG
jgi:lactate dehydrogenase-like 2-hydroxyacid dehydrogenase